MPCWSYHTATILGPATHASTMGPCQLYHIWLTPEKVLESMWVSWSLPWQFVTDMERNSILVWRVKERVSLVATLPAKKQEDKKPEVRNREWDGAQLWGGMRMNDGLWGTVLTLTKTLNTNAHFDIDIWQTFILILSTRDGKPKEKGWTGRKIEGNLTV